MALNIKELKGIQGEVTVPSIGLTVGTMQSWEIRRRGDLPAGETAVWSLRAVFSYINGFAFSKEDLTKKITIQLGNRKTGKRYDVVVKDKSVVRLNGKTLVIEGAELCLVE